MAVPTGSISPTSRRSGAQSAERTLAVLRCFETVTGDLGVTEIAARTGLTVSTAHRLTRALCHAGLLVQDPWTERYQLGPVLVVLGRKAEHQLGYAQAQPILEGLASDTGESVNLGIRAGAEVLVVLAVPSSQPLRFDQLAGSRVPIHTSAMGKCLLAYPPVNDDPLRDLPRLSRLTARTITRREQLAAEIERTRGRGWALNDEERNPGVRAVGAPVLDANHVAVAAVAAARQVRETAEAVGPVLVPGG
jgi:DNA-binding IclR family transcriptional regulator